MLARMAREGGWSVTVAASSDRPPASAAALCVVNPMWWRGQQRAAVRAALREYGRLRAVSCAEATYTAWNKVGSTIRQSFYGIDPARVLVEPDLELDWFAEGRPDGYDVVALCMGADSDREGKRAWGVTTIVNAPSSTLACHLAGPRRLLFAACHDAATTRFGSSVAADMDTAFSRQIRDEHNAGGLLPEGERSYVAGVRLMATPKVRRDGSVWSLDGFARVGYSLAPAEVTFLLAAIAAQPQ